MTNEDELFALNTAYPGYVPWVLLSDGVWLPSGLRECPELWLKSVNKWLLDGCRVPPPQIDDPTTYLGEVVELYKLDCAEQKLMAERGRRRRQLREKIEHSRDRLHALNRRLDAAADLVGTAWIIAMRVVYGDPRISSALEAKGTGSHLDYDSDPIHPWKSGSDFTSPPIPQRQALGLEKFMDKPGACFDDPSILDDLRRLPVSRTGYHRDRVADKKLRWWPGPPGRKRERPEGVSLGARTG